MAKGIDEILLKPAEWQYDDYQKAKSALHKDLLALLPERHTDGLGGSAAARRAGFNAAITEITTALNTYFGGESDE